MNGFQAPTDRYGNQFATRVEHKNGLFSADVVQEATGLGWFRLVIGGVVLSPMFETKEDAVDAADAILCRLVEGELLVERMPEEGPEDQAPDFSYDDYPGDVLPTGWDAQDHKALYE
jgi:hypothetical protein